MPSLPENSIEEFLDAGLKQTDEFKRSVEKNANLLHRVFVQNEDGAELLALWRDSLIMTPTLDGESTSFSAGLNEGEKRFIRNLIVQLQSVEKNDE